MLSVVHVAKFYPPVRGGMERVVQSLATLARDRLDSRVIAFGTARRTVEECVDGVPITRVGTLGSAGSTPISPSFFGALKNARADLMILHEPNPWALLAWAAVRPAMPLVIWFHSEVVRPRLQYALFYAPVARPAYDRAARLVVSSPRLAERARVLQRLRDRLEVIPFGVGAEAWSAGEDVRRRAEDIRRRLRAPIVLFAGRLVAYKGVDVLIRAAAPLPVSVAVIGGGPMQHQWSALAASSGGPARIVFTGELEDRELHAYFAAADMFVLPSTTRAEAFGYVQLEAMASGTPVISTDLPTGVPWVNQDGETGLVVPPGDVGALRAAIEKLAGDPGLRARLGAAASVRVRRDFTLDAMSDRLVALCRDVVERTT